MSTLGELLSKQQLAYTMYSPDCTRSHLWGNLDDFIHTKSGFAPVKRVWVNHSVNTINRVYTPIHEQPPPERDTGEILARIDTLPPEQIQAGHLTVKHFITGASLVTLWRGEGVIEELSTLKGDTHPAEVKPDTVRGGFWCDNAVCNLMHVSDGYAEVEHELIGMALDAVLEHKAQTLPLFEPITPTSAYMPHCAISVVFDVVRRLAMVQGELIPSVELPKSGNAWETQVLFSTVLRDIATQQTLDSLIAQFIEAYLGGDLVAVMAQFSQLPLTPWESFVIQCGTLGRDQWRD